MRKKISYRVKSFDPTSIIDKSKPIEYKKVDENVFKKDGYTVSKTFLTPDNDGFLTEPLFKQIDLKESSTEVLNISTGLGKTTAIYTIIKKLYQQSNAVIILATPFISLVDKDYQSLTGTDKTFLLDPEHIVDYRNLKEKTEIINKKNIDSSISEKETQIRDFQQLFIENKKLHIITVHSLLGNPGDTAFEQNLLKKNYTLGLLDYCIKEKKRVYLFIDEIHASIDNFQNRFIYSLTRWKKVVHKCFVSTATFTESVNIVIKHLAYLTNDKINILENKRIKKTNLSELEILFTKFPYSKNDLHELKEFIPTWLEGNGYLKFNSKKNFHILAYSRNLAKMIYKDRDSRKGPHNWWAFKENVNLVVGNSEDKEEFNQKQCNIGTKFSTGININSEDEEEKDALIIIFPCRYSEWYAKGEEGIFSNGLPSILQSVARLRNGGKMLFIIPPMPEMIECDVFDQLKKELPPNIFENTKIRKTENLDCEYRLIEELRKRDARKYNKEKKRYEDDIENSNIKRPEIQFPNDETFILERGQEFLKHKNLKSGKSITPYVLWAALNNQFLNTSLETIYYYKYLYVNVSLRIKSILSDMHAHVLKYADITKIKPDDFKEFEKNVKALFRTVEDKSKIYKVNLRIDSKYIDPKKRFLAKKDKLVLISYYFLVTANNKAVFIDEYHYIKYRIQHSKSLSEVDLVYDSLKRNLDDIYNNFKGQHFKVKDLVLNNSFFTSQRIDSLRQCIIGLKKDPVIQHLRVFNLKNPMDNQKLVNFIFEKFIVRNNRIKNGAKQIVGIKV